jgi:predicted alpha/beta-hydrolase family hydrolase
LFVHGVRDTFGTMEELRAALALIPARTEMVEIAGAGHSLKPGVAALCVQRLPVL